MIQFTVLATYLFGVPLIVNATIADGNFISYALVFTLWSILNTGAVGIALAATEISK